MMGQKISLCKMIRDIKYFLRPANIKTSEFRKMRWLYENITKSFTDDGVGINCHKQTSFNDGAQTIGVKILTDMITVQAHNLIALITNGSNGEIVEQATVYVKSSIETHRVKHCGYAART